MRNSCARGMSNCDTFLVVLFSFRRFCTRSFSVFAKPDGWAPIIFLIGQHGRKIFIIFRNTTHTIGGVSDRAPLFNPKERGSVAGTLLALYSVSHGLPHAASVVTEEQQRAKGRARGPFLGTPRDTQGVFLGSLLFYFFNTFIAAVIAVE